MAFVYRSKEYPQNKRPITPSPTTYKINSQKYSHNNATTFNDKTLRQIWNNNQNPGPGAYTKQNINDQALYIDDTVQLICADMNNRAKGCYSSFKSKSKRLDIKRPQTPGPGYYQTQSNSNTKSINPNKTKKPSQLTKYLFFEAKKQGFKIQNESKPIENVFIYEQTSEQCEQFQHNKKLERQSVVFASRVGRAMQVKRPMTSVGPGSYNLSKSYQALNKKHLKVDKVTTIRKTSQYPDFLKQSIEAIPSQIGPGKYSIKSAFCPKKQSQSQGISCFGSLQSRFQKTPNHKIAQQKQKYEQTFKVQELKQKQTSQKGNEYKKKVPFMSATSKQKNSCVKNINKNNGNACPGYYNIGNNMYDKIIKKNSSNKTNKIQRNLHILRDLSYSYVNKENEQENKKNLQIVCGNVENKVEIKKNSTKQSAKKYMKKDQWSKTSQIPKFMSIKTPDDRPVCYDPQSQTFNKKFETKQQRQAPFMTKSERFKSTNINLQAHLIKQYQENVDKLAIKVQNIEKNTNGKQKQNKNNRIRKFLQSAKNHQTALKKHVKNQQRIICDEKQNYLDVGPQSYNPQIPKKGKSHNILFSSNKNI